LRQVTVTRQEILPLLDEVKLAPVEPELQEVLRSYEGFFWTLAGVGSGWSYEDWIQFGEILDPWQARPLRWRDFGRPIEELRALMRQN
jgi:hypothetical protein